MLKLMKNWLAIFFEDRISVRVYVKTHRATNECRADLLPSTMAILSLDSGHSN